MVSSCNSRLTYSSSRRPRIAKGKIYGFGETAGLDRLMLNWASGTEDVSRANWIAMLKNNVNISIGIAIIRGRVIGGHVLVNRFIVV